MTTEQTLKDVKKSPGRARKVGLPATAQVAPKVPLIPLPGDAQAYGAYLSFLALVARSATSSMWCAKTALSSPSTSLAALLVGSLLRTVTSSGTA